jgi:ADP-ribose pyrophosphatase YjhB (NUDIX family)
VAIYNDAGQLLLVQRGRPPGKGTWTLPGGLIDLGERLEAAAQREIMEEVGLTIEVGALVTTFESIVHDAEGKIEYHYVVLDFWARYVDGTPVASDDAAAVMWVEMAELDHYAPTPRQREIYEQTYAAWRAARTTQPQEAGNP